MPTVPKKMIGNIPSTSTVQKERLRKKLYNNRKWRELRDAYLVEHPLCERCLESGVTSPTEEIHHKHSPFKEGLSENERYQLLLDWDNLEALCKPCHLHEHAVTRKNQTI